MGRRLTLARQRPTRMVRNGFAEQSEGSKQTETLFAASPTVEAIRAASVVRGTICDSQPSSRVEQPAHAACTSTLLRCLPAQPSVIRRSRLGYKSSRELTRDQSRL